MASPPLAPRWLERPRCQGRVPGIHSFLSLKTSLRVSHRTWNEAVLPPVLYISLLLSGNAHSSSFGLLLPNFSHWEDRLHFMGIFLKLGREKYLSFILSASVLGFQLQMISHCAVMPRGQSRWGGPASTCDASRESRNN